MKKSIFVLFGQNTKPKLYKREGFLLKALESMPNLSYQSFNDEIEAIEFIEELKNNSKIPPPPIPQDRS